MNNQDTIGVAITGASGAVYGLRLLECLIQAGQTVQLMVSAPAHVVFAMEMDLQLPTRPAELQAFFSARFNAAPGQLQVYGRDEWAAPVASGSNAPRAMVVCPCSSGTLAAIAHGLSRSLIERAADVVLKERKQLILVTRETPLSAIHLENMLTLTRMGALMLPAAPGFYHKPQTIAQLVDFVVARVLQHLHIAQDLIPRWGDVQDE